MIKISKDIQDVLLMIALQGLNYVAPLIVYPYLMIVLGAEKFGILSFSLTIAQYFMLIVDFGFNLSATKRIAQSKSQQEKNRIFTSTILAKTALLACAALIMLLLDLLNVFPIYQNTMWIMFVMVVANAYFFIWFYQGIGKIKTVTLINVISKLLILPLTFLFVGQQGDIKIAAFILSAVYLLGSLINIFVLMYQKQVKLVSVTSKEILHEIKESFPVFLSSASTSIYTSFFVVLLGIVSTPVVVGMYASAEKIMRSLCFLFVVPISQVFYPKLSNMALTQPENTKILFHKILKYTLSLMVVLMLALIVFSNEITNFLGPDYMAASNYLRVIAIALLFIPLGSVTGQLGLLALGDNAAKQKYKNVYMLAAPISLILVGVLVSIFAGIGAVFALVLTEAFVGILMFYYFKKMISW